MRLVACLLLAACGFANAPLAVPVRGPVIQVENWNPRPLRVVAVDGMGSYVVLGTVLEHRTGCWRWPFTDRVGYLVAGTDTLYFQPWTKPGWRLDPATHILGAAAGSC